MEAGGVMNSVNATSFEKMIIDFEIIRQVKFVHTPFPVDEEALNVDEIVELAQDGSFVDADSTLGKSGLAEEWFDKIEELAAVE